MPSNDEILEKVQETLVDALGIDDDEATPDATLVGDLGAESIDFLDIVFRLEKTFDIKIPRGELFPENLAGMDRPHVAGHNVSSLNQGFRLKTVKVESVIFLQSSAFSLFLMIVNDFHVVRTVITPLEADPPLLVDSNAVLPLPVTTQGLETIAW